MAGNRRAIWIVLVLWTGAVVMSALALTAEPTGDGFTRGLNRLSGFIGWQALALILALAAWMASRPLPKSDLLRWLGRVPGWAAMALIVFIAGMIAVGVMMNRPPDATPPDAPPATEVPDPSD